LFNTGRNHSPINYKSYFQIYILNHKKDTENIKTFYSNLYQKITMENFFENAQKFLSNNPEFMGLGLVFLGLYMIWTSRNPESDIYSGPSGKRTFANVRFFFGFKVARNLVIFTGILSIILGIILGLYFFSLKNK
jgi:hypothetical protein